MITIENTNALGWDNAIRGMRNPMNSWPKSDSSFIPYEDHQYDSPRYRIGPTDISLMRKLAESGTSDHRKFMRMIIVYADITAPLYWWKEFDTYKVGTVANSCSTMHTIAKEEFTVNDFSCEHLLPFLDSEPYLENTTEHYAFAPMDILKITIRALNQYRHLYILTKDKEYWWQMIQLLPSSYNQKRTIMVNYEVLRNMYASRHNHKLNEWRDLCKWIKKLPISGLITEEWNDKTEITEDGVVLPV